ncbi:MAG: polyhydroxyalkanoate depolymerase [Betaproteobacteria bacterium]|nr:polyhydroxyalkanoate depolymerase [Betaproteobacteria bacterium]
MLYSLFEAQHAALAPMRLMAELSRGWFGHPFSPFTLSPLAKEITASSDLFLRVTNRYEKPKWGLDTTTVNGREVPVEEEVTLHKPFCRLIHFKRAASSKDDRKILVVAPLSGHHSTLLRDTVRTMLPDNDVYVTDWVDARMVPMSAGPFHLDDYVDYVREFIRLLSPDLNVVSVCQPTVPVLAAMALMAEDKEPDLPRTMIMMGGPIDARKSPTAVNNLATKRPYSWFEQTLIQRVPMKYPGYSRRVYPGFLQHLGFVAMNPDRHMDAHWDYYNQLVANDGDSADAHRRFYDEYNAVLDMPAEYYLDTIRRVFQEFQLPQGRMFVHEQWVRPEKITKTALFTIEGEHDDISGNGQTEAAHGLCTGVPASKREHFLVPDVGHYGIFSGRRYREIIYPRMRAFMDKHSK